MRVTVCRKRAVAGGVIRLVTDGAHVVAGQVVTVAHTALVGAVAATVLALAATQTARVAVSRVVTVAHTTLVGAVAVAVPSVTAERARHHHHAKG